jgi:hypothetical protein
VLLPSIGFGLLYLLCLLPAIVLHFRSMSSVRCRSPRGCAGAWGISHGRRHDDGADGSVLWRRQVGRLTRLQRDLTRRVAPAAAHRKRSKLVLSGP